MYSLKQVVSKSCAYYGVSWKEFCGKRTGASAVKARRVAWYILYDHSGLTYSKIGRYCKRDHSSVLEGVKKARESSETLAVAHEIMNSISIRKPPPSECEPKPKPRDDVGFDFRNDNLELPKHF